NCTNMFDEMKYASLIHKYKNHDATVFPSWKILRMATIEAARALCMEEDIGSLREGKLADLIILDLSGPQMNPIYERPIRNLVPNLVYSALGNEVESVMIDGTFVIEDRKLLTGDEAEIIGAVNRAAARISQDMEALSWTAGLPLAQWTRDGYY
ncbi:MAG: amidohydrolase family protein, partial [Clostridium sp.]|nr:amidohydrolase family protein [Clostridium sp.]